MAKPYTLPKAKVLNAVMIDNTATVTVAISQESYLSFPIAPADLRQTHPHKLVFPFHQLVGRENKQLIFETYHPKLSIPVTGNTYTFCSWWTRWAMNAVLDKSMKWELQDYPNKGHDHCLLTWETIAAYANERRGYHSSHGWITVAAYQKFIMQDILFIRRCPRSIDLK